MVLLFVSNPNVFSVLLVDVTAFYFRKQVSICNKRGGRIHIKFSVSDAHDCLLRVQPRFRFVVVVKVL